MAKNVVTYYYKNADINKPARLIDKIIYNLVRNGKLKDCGGWPIFDKRNRKVGLFWEVEGASIVVGILSKLTDICFGPHNYVILENDSQEDV